ncbi:MAG: FimB/Mfa2 family fimbrial subunit [Muribaculaceae bacterium]|nr:FimB/Mfa2 family fimbrial subunit [Muribaculaceae bacterium]
MIYDEEGDCDPYYKVRFVYDWNMNFADAFPNEVLSVTLYAVNADGDIVWSKHESGEALTRDGYLMDVEVDPGDYTFIAWCGQGHRTSFSVAEAQKHTGLVCSLNHERDTDGTAHSRKDLDRLYHGTLEASLPDTQGTHIYTMKLKKNTNVVRVALQQQQGLPINPEDFHFSITDSNGVMDWDNSLLGDEAVTYHPWSVRQGSAGIYLPETESRAVVTGVNAVLTEFTTARLMKDHEARLTVRNAKGETIISIPVIDFGLMFKGENYRSMDDQEYLDREDHWNMVFFLDENQRWIDTHIFINSWKLVLQNVEI